MNANDVRVLRAMGFAPFTERPPSLAAINPPRVARQLGLTAQTVKNAFDAVVSQFGLMFFQDRVRALREMRRVLRAGGRVAVAVWAALDRSPAYSTLSGLLRRRFGDAIGDENDAPFVLGDPTVLGELFRRAGFDDASVGTMGGTAMFPSFDRWMHTEIKGWTLADKVTEEQYAQFVAEARPELGRYVEPDGGVRFPIAAHIVTASARPTP